mgnify:CR=1 FL=1
MKIKPKVMNREIALYEIYSLTKAGQLIRIYWISSTNDYDHSRYELHHYIPYSIYERGKEWFQSRGIKQKLILMQKHTHEQVHFQAIKNLTDSEFQEHYKIPRWELIFNRKHFIGKDDKNG